MLSYYFRNVSCSGPNHVLLRFHELDEELASAKDSPKKWHMH